MTEAAVMIWPNKGQKQPSLRLDKAMRDALADLARRRWPSGTAKAAAVAWDLSADEGKRLVKGRASQTTIEKILKTGGWSVAFPLLAEVIGQTAEEYIIGARKANAESGERLASLVSNMWALGPAADHDSTDLDYQPSQQRRRYRG